MINDEQLKNNQTFIDLIEEYISQYDIKIKDDIDAKSLMKYIWNKGYCLTKRNEC